MKKVVWTIALLLTFVPSSIIAHEGHGVIDTGPAHYMLSLVHFLPIIAVLASSIYLFGKRVFRKAWISRLFFGVSILITFSMVDITEEKVLYNKALGMEKIYLEIVNLMQERSELLISINDN